MLEQLYAVNHNNKWIFATPWTIVGSLSDPIVVSVWVPKLIGWDKWWDKLTWSLDAKTRSVNFSSVQIVLLGSFHLYNCKILEKTHNNACSLMQLLSSCSFPRIIACHNKHSFTSYLNQGTFGTCTSQSFMLSIMLQCDPL